MTAGWVILFGWGRLFEAVCNQPKIIKYVSLHECIYIVH